MHDFRLRDLLTLETLISRSLVRLLYVIGLVVGATVSVSYLLGAVARLQYDVAGGAGSLAVVALLSVAGLLVWRVLCEALFLAHAIHERLVEVSANTRGKPQGRCTD